MLANKLASEILQCSIDFFNKLRDEEPEYDPGEAALTIARYAKSIGATGQTKRRIDESIDVIQEWVDDAPERQKKEAAAEDIAFVSSKLDNFQNLNDSIDNANSLVVACKPKLSNIRNALGVYDNFYLQISSGVVHNALGMIIAVVNKAQEGLQYDRSKLITLPTTISAALSALNLIGSLDMVDEVREYYNTNKRTITSINSQLQAVKTAASSYTSSASRSSSSGGCYIATMAYGSYEHPQVMVLRRYRDEVLARNKLGNALILIYYAISPHLVERFRNHYAINQLIRKTLDRFIKLINR